MNVRVIVPGPCCGVGVGTDVAVGNAVIMVVAEAAAVGIAVGTIVAVGCTGVGVVYPISCRTGAP